MNLQEGVTTILWNGQIGGHAAGDDERVHSSDMHRSCEKDSKPREDQRSDDYSAWDTVEHSEEDVVWPKE